ncbi:MAG: Uma2 family endonuclease [Aggregatilineales bacterium]
MTSVAQTAAKQATDRPGMALSEYLRRSFQGERFEIIDGSIIPMTATVSGHIRLIKRLFLLLNAFVEASHLGEVFSEMTYTIKPPDDPNWVTGSLTPDVAFVSTAQLAAHPATPETQSQPFTLVPDLAVEVMSPNDTYTKALGKAARYFEDGVRLVWLLDFERRTVSVCHPNEPPTLLSGEQLLTGNAVLPGFSVAVDRLFSD